MGQSLQRVRDYVESKSLNVILVQFQESTKTSALAAAVLGCSIGEIAKSVVFVGRSTIVVVVVVISGDKRVSVEKLSSVVGEKLRIATAAEVLERTGYAVGGVPPFPHPPGVMVFLDASTRRFGSVWAAGGEENAVFQISVHHLARTVGNEKEVDVAA